MKEFVVVLKGLTDAERVTVANFLIANRKLPFGFFWPFGGGIYQVIWTDNAVEWTDDGGKLSSTQLIFSAVT